MLVGGQSFLADLLPTNRQPPFHIVAALTAAARLTAAASVRRRGAGPPTGGEEKTTAMASGSSAEGYYPPDLSSWPVSIVASLPFPQLQELEGLHTHPDTEEAVALYLPWHGDYFCACDCRAIAQLPRLLPDALAVKGVAPELWQKWRSNLIVIDNKWADFRGLGCIGMPCMVLAAPALIAILLALAIASLGAVPYAYIHHLRRRRHAFNEGLANWQAEVNADLQQVGVASVFVKTQSVVCLDNQSGTGGAGHVNSPTYPTHALVAAGFVVFALCAAEAERLRRDPHIGPMVVNLSSIQALPGSPPEVPAGTPGGGTWPGQVGPGAVHEKVQHSMTEWVRRWMRLHCIRESSDEELAKLVMLPPRNGIGKYTMGNLGHWADAKGRRDAKANAGAEGRAWFRQFRLTVDSSGDSEAR